RACLLGSRTISLRTCLHSTPLACARRQACGRRLLATSPAYRSHLGGVVEDVVETTGRLDVDRHVLEADLPADALEELGGQPHIVVGCRAASTRTASQRPSRRPGAARGGSPRGSG